MEHQRRGPPHGPAAFFGGGPGTKGTVDNTGVDAELAGEHAAPDWTGAVSFTTAVQQPASVAPQAAAFADETSGQTPPEVQSFYRASIRPST